ncbi:MAG TPA: septal ring lytic transglycosylase RlpA family protein [Longimicrobiales bacterium]
MRHSPRRAAVLASGLLLAACVRGGAGSGDPIPEPARPSSEPAVRPGHTPPGDGGHAADAGGRAEDGAAAGEPAAAEFADRPSLETRIGVASYYADRLEGRLTASGIPYDKEALVAAHRSYPFGTVLRVTNLENRRTVVVRVIDRGPFVDGRIIDLSRRAAERLGFILEGLARVRIEVLEFAGRGDGGP